LAELRQWLEWKLELRLVGGGNGNRWGRQDKASS
jgi:hypothetical protein